MIKSGLFAGILIMFFAAVAVFGMVCCQTSKAERTEAQEHMDHDHDDGDDRPESGHDHDHDHEEGALLSREEIMAAICEHGVKTITCDGCRYEVGVVLVQPEIIAQGTSGGLVQVGSVKKQQVDKLIETTGEVAVNENNTVHIRPRITGVIRKTHVDFGEHVKEDDPLVTIDSIELGEVVAELLKAHASMVLANATYDREKTLYLKKVSSEKEMLEAKAEMEKAKIELESSKRKLMLYGMNALDIAQLIKQESSRSNLITIYSPQDGMIIEKHAVRGELVTQETELFLISDVSSVWVWADVYERDLSPLIAAQSKGKIKAVVTVDAFPNHPFEGDVDYIGAISDETTRTVKMRINTNNGGLLLRPGMFARILVTTSGDRDFLAVPGDAVLSDEGNDFVFKRLVDNYFVRSFVKTGNRFGSFVEVLEGLEEGDNIVTGGAFLLKSDVLRFKMGAGCAD